MYPSIWHKKINFQVKESVIIVGGGIAGLSIAYWLSKNGVKSLLLEKESIGSSASGRNAGFLTGGSLAYFQTLLTKYGKEKALEKWFYTKNNIDLLIKELDLKKNSKSFIPQGTMTLFKSADKKYDEAFEILKQSNYPVDKIESPLKGFSKAYLFKDEAFNNPMETLSLLKKKVEDHCLILEGVSVSSIEKDFVQTNIGIMKFSKVFVATNSALNELCELKEKIIPNRAQIAFFSTSSKLPLSNIMVPEERVYLRSHENGLLIGGLRLIDADIEKTSEVKPNEKIQTALKDWASLHFSNIELKQKWAGIMGFTHDEVPISGKLVDKEVYYLGGFSGHGNGYAFKMAKELVESAIL